MPRKAAGPSNAVDEKKLDDKLRQMLRDFGRALSEAISDSSEASRKLREIRDEGYSLYILLDGGKGEATLRARATARAADPDGAEPEFRIHAGDLKFLRSIGIDPTRRPRRRRTA
jgi:hypothetical protein